MDKETIRYIEVIFKDVISEQVSEPFNFAYKEIIRSVKIPWEDGRYVDGVSYEDNMAAFVLELCDDGVVRISESKFVPIHQVLAFKRCETIDENRPYRENKGYRRKARRFDKRNSVSNDNGVDLIQPVQPTDTNTETTKEENI